MTHVPEDLLEVYRRYAKRHGGVAVAIVTPDETCSYCRVRLRPHTFQKLTEAISEEIIHCESCNLILYYSPPAQPPAAAAAAPQKSDA
jgi:predicted  nucleic acid-binding Zn-ribbon protein